MIKVGIIGGTGFEQGLDLLNKKVIKKFETPYGYASDDFVAGELWGVDVVFLPRHASDHKLPPSKINYRANIYSLKKLNCTHLIATNACGSLQANVKPGDFLVLDQIFDYTFDRECTFYDGSGRFDLDDKKVKHCSAAFPFNEQVRGVLIKSLESNNFSHHKSGTIAVVSGPRFSTKFESKFFSKIGCDAIGMTSSPEAFLALEVGLSYASVGLVTDYDSWNDAIKPVDEASVYELFKTSLKNLQKVVETAVQQMAFL